MYCNQIFSILKKKIEPVIETPIEDTPLEEEVIEETIPEEVVEPTEPETDPAEVTPGEELIEGETEIEEPTETESEEPTEEETVTENTEEAPVYVVANVIVCTSYEIASRIARCEFGESALAIDTTLFPVAIGDTYINGIFYDSEGNVIERNLTESEQIEALMLANTEQKEIIESQAEKIALLNELLLEMLIG